MKSARRGLMTGRFQPFHNGHLDLARQILKECDELIIMIGSAQFNYIEKDPFTAGERVLMIYNALAEAKLDLRKCYIIPIQNSDNNSGWLAYVRSMVPQFDVLYTGNDFVKYLAESQDPKLTVKAPKFSKKKEYNGSYIRKLIVTGKPWKHLVPNAVADVMDELRGVKRIRMLARSDTIPQKW